MLKSMPLSQDSRVQQLLLIRQSPSYVDRLVAQLQQCITAAERLESGAHDKARTRADLHGTIGRESRKLKQVLEDTRVLKARVEQAIGALFDGRRINIVGEINAL